MQPKCFPDVGRVFVCLDPSGKLQMLQKALLVEDLRMRLDAASEAKIQAEIQKEVEKGAVNALVSHVWSVLFGHLVWQVTWRTVCRRCVWSSENGSTMGRACLRRRD